MTDFDDLIHEAATQDAWPNQPPEPKSPAPEDVVPTEELPDVPTKDNGSITNLNPAAAGAPPELLVVQPLTDVGNAEILAEIAGERLRYNQDEGCWLAFDGKVWRNDRRELHRLYRRIIAHRYAVARSGKSLVTTEGQEITAAEAFAWANTTASNGRIKALLEVASSMPAFAVRAEDFDTDRWLLNCRNGTLDLRTGELRKHRAEDLITRITKANFDPKAACPRFRAFISQIALRRKGLEVYIQGALGYSLSGSVQEQVLFVLVGKGANGKSTLIDVFFDVLGSYAKTTPAHTFVKSESRAIRNDLARLKGARFVSAVEINMGKKLDEALTKRLTGGDRITARFLGKEFFEFLPEAKFFLAVNVNPEVSGADDGIYRRLRIVPFDASFALEEMDKDLPNKLKEERDGILAWAFEGFQRWQANGRLIEPECVTEACEGFREMMDTTQAFLDDCTDEDPTGRVPVGSLHDAYLAWAKASCVEPAGKNNFGKLVRQNGLKQSRVDRARYWTGVKLSQTATDRQREKATEATGAEPEATATTE